MAHVRQRDFNPPPSCSCKRPARPPATRSAELIRQLKRPRELFPTGTSQRVSKAALARGNSGAPAHATGRSRRPQSRQAATAAPPGRDAAR
eukprot:9472406-Pyramimonas_sp.AAC.2